MPNALVRWSEESRVLDGDSLHDCMTACKPQILEVSDRGVGTSCPKPEYFCGRWSRVADRRS